MINRKRFVITKNDIDVQFYLNLHLSIYGDPPYIIILCMISDPGKKQNTFWQV